MDRWEYMTWLVTVTGLGHWPEWTGGKVRFCNGEPVPSWDEGPPVSEAMNAAGERGWELVSVNDAGSIFVFKRRKAAE